MAADYWGGYFVQRGSTALTPADLALYKGDKFADPWWSCIDRGGADEVAKTSATIGYLLATPRTGEARVAAMRSRIGALGVLASGRVLSSFRRGSEDLFRDIASDIEKSIGTAAGRKALADKLGIPVSAIDERKTQMESLFAEHRELRVLFEQLLTIIGPPIIAGIRDAISAASGATSAAAGFSSAMSAVPFIGQMITFVVQMIATQKAEGDATKRALCADTARKLESILRELQKKRWPFQWHWEPFGEIGCSGSADEQGDNGEHQQGLLERLFEWLREFEAIGAYPEYRSAVKEWWSSAVTYMSDQRVAEVFNAFGNDPWGGRMASDEQVMLVAAPIAVANGFDPDKFAAALWDRSAGWSGASPGLLRKDDVRREWIKCPGFLSAGSCRGTGEFEALCPDTVRNALFVQLAVLARDARTLANEWRELAASLPKVPSSKAAKTMIGAISSMPKIGSASATTTGSSGWGGVVMAAMGAIGSGALWWFRAPLALVVAPAALGVAAWYAHARPRPVTALIKGTPKIDSAAILSSKLAVSGWGTSGAPSAWRLR